LDGALAVDDDLLARLVDLGAAEVPQERIRERGRIAEAVSERLPDWLALGLELLANLAILVPRLGEFLGPDLLEQRAPIGDGVGADPVWHRQPPATDLRARAEHIVEAPLALADGFGDVGHI